MDGDRIFGMGRRESWQMSSFQIGNYDIYEISHMIDSISMMMILMFDYMIYTKCLLVVIF